MGAIKSSLCSKKKDLLLEVNHKLSEISQAIKQINSRLDELEATKHQYLTSIHQKEEILQKIEIFLEEKASVLTKRNLQNISVLESLENLENNNNYSEIITQSKSIKKQEKHSGLKQRIIRRKHSEKFEKARNSVKEEKIFGNLENLHSKDEESPIKLTNSS